MKRTNIVTRLVLDGSFSLQILKDHFRAGPLDLWATGLLDHWTSGQAEKLTELFEVEGRGLVAAFQHGLGQLSLVAV